MTTISTSVWNDDLPWASIHNTVKESEDLSLDRIDEYEITAQYYGNIWAVTISDEIL